TSTSPTGPCRRGCTPTAKSRSPTPSRRPAPSPSWRPRRSSSPRWARRSTLRTTTAASSRWSRRASSARSGRPTAGSAGRTTATGSDWIVCEYEFPARGERPPVKLTWYDGDKRPNYFAEGKLPKWGDGTLFVGDKGMILADYGRRVVLPLDEFKGVDGDGSIPK